MAKNKQRKEYSKPYNKVTWAQAFRDVVIASIEKGQLPVLFGFGSFFLLIWKLDSSDSLVLLNSILEKLSDWYLYGYVLFLLSILGWYSSSKNLHKMHFEECDRVGREKTELQDKLLNGRSS